MLSTVYIVYNISAHSSDALLYVYLLAYYFAAFSIGHSEHQPLTHKPRSCNSGVGWGDTPYYPDLLCDHLSWSQPVRCSHRTILLHNAQTLWLWCARL